MKISEVTDRKVAYRGLQIYNILAGAAAHHQIITYGHLAKLMNYKGAGVLAQPLNHVLAWCRFNDLPPLTSLVVNRETGLPGPGMTAPGEFNANQMKVMS